MRYVASSFGSAGDFLPTLVIAKALRDAGHDVLFVTNPFHEPAVRRAGLDFEGAGTYVDVFNELEANPVYLDTFNGPRSLWANFGKPYVETTYRALKETLPSFVPDAVIGSNLAHGVFWAAHEAEIPSVMIGATPLAWMSRAAPMQFLDRRIPGWMLPALSGLTAWVVRKLAGNLLRGLARELQVTSIDPTITGVERAATLHLGMWSAAVRPPAGDDPPNTRMCGFARAGHLGARAEVPPAVEAFLEAGPPPVVVGLGSAFSVIGGDTLEALAAACAELGLRCLIVGHPAGKTSFSGDTLAVPYAPYHLVFPRALAVVIHSGAGTTGEALRSGRPVVAVPFGYDQFALSWQVERLNVGVRVSKAKRSVADLVRALERVTSDQALASNAAALASRLREEPDGAAVAAELITGLGAFRRSSPSAPAPRPSRRRAGSEQATPPPP